MSAHHHVVVVGAGFSGIGAAIGLRQAGIADLVTVEDEDGVGDAWHGNTYPGVAVDIPSFGYQFSDAMRSGWSRTYAPGSELKAYATQANSYYSDANGDVPFRPATTMETAWRSGHFPLGDYTFTSARVPAGA